jgi:hypothetical protein
MTKQWMRAMPHIHRPISCDRPGGNEASRRLDHHITRNPRGLTIETKHVDVTFTIFELIEVQLFDFMEAGIMFGLDIEIDPVGTTLSFESSYGVHGRIKAKRIAISFEPGPDRPS